MMAPERLKSLAGSVLAQAHASYEALTNRDAQLARAVIAADQSIDRGDAARQAVLFARQLASAKDSRNLTQPVKFSLAKPGNFKYIFRFIRRSRFAWHSGVVFKGRAFARALMFEREKLKRTIWFEREELRFDCREW